MKRISVLLSGLVFSSVLVSSACASTVYSQPPAATPVISGWMSQTGAHTGNSQATQAFDDFTLATTGTFSIVSWRGVTSADNLLIDSFTISIYSNDFTLRSDGPPADPGAVGTLLASYVLSPSDFFQGPGSTDQNTRLTSYDFNATLSTPFTATAGTTYWISILADIEGGDYSWALGDSTGRDGYFLSLDSTGVSRIDQLPVDLAFTLSSPTVTPEPSALLLTGTGLLGSLGMLRRRMARR